MSGSKSAYWMGIKILVDTMQLDLYVVWTCSLNEQSTGEVYICLVSSSCNNVTWKLLFNKEIDFPLSDGEVF